MTDAGKLRGGCLCGAVQFLVDDAFQSACYCHCSRCRRRTGSAFSAFGGIEAAKLQVTAGSEHLLKVGDRPEACSYFCSICHCALYHLFPPRNWIHVQLGALRDAPSKRPDQHIHVASKAPWHEITDALPQWPELPEH
jgi:hypothetical protein